MATLPMGVRVFVSTQSADMRKSFDGLMALTRRSLGQDPVSGDLFAFQMRIRPIVTGHFGIVTARFGRS